MSNVIQFHSDGADTYDFLNKGIPAGLTTLSDATVDLLFATTRRLAVSVVDYRELMMMYSCALQTVQTKFDILNTEFKVRNQRNPISSISTRLKSTASIVDKLDRHGYDFSLESIEAYVNDVAGIRVVCPYIDDIYQIADALLRQDDVTLFRSKDYIKSPKPNGYRSLHLVVSVPIYFSDQKREMKVEVQIRTIAMDFWASLEHQIKYKKDIPNQEDIISQLQTCADEIALTDEKMYRIRCQIEAAGGKPSEDEILFNKLSKLDFTIG